MSVSGLTALSTNNPVTNNRSVLDANKIVTVALPATATTANTNAINLEVAVPFPTPETINIGVLWSASASGNNVNSTVGLQHTEANSDGTANSANWLNIPTLTTTIINQTNVVAAGRATYKLPPLTKQYIRAQFSSPANTGNLADSTGTLELEF